MIYLICFIISVLFLLRILTYGRTVDISMLMLTAVIAIGNGGFYALSVAKNLEEAILANKICYVIGIFAPVIVFHIVCGICRIKLPQTLSIVLYFIQILIYMSVCMIGTNTWFYRTVEFHPGNPGYLTKTYGPMHMAYLISMIIYTLLSLILGLVSLERKTIVSRLNVTILVFVNMLAVGVYIIERITHINIELMPVAYVISLFILLIPLLRVYIYSVYNNQYILIDRIKKTGYIVFDRKLRYMGRSEYALVLFPELNTWELEKKIPGNGGRFNTFLRQPLLEYTKHPDQDEICSGTYEYKDEIFNYEIGKLRSSGSRFKGYTVQVACITDAVRENING